MYHGRSVGVVVPAYNEEGLVGDVIETMPAFVDRIYVVDDASTDGTWEEIEACTSTDGCRSHPDHHTAPNGGADGRVVAHRHEENRGVGGAIKTGYLLALEDGIDVTAVMGGDGQMSPDELSNIVDPVVRGEAEYAKGNRLARPDYRTGMGAWRSFGNSLLSLLTKIASGYWHLSDSQNGFTAISRPALEVIDVASMYEYYGYCNDLLIRLNVNDFPVVDVPMRAIYGEEKSSIAYPEYIRKVSLLLLRGFLWRLHTKYVQQRFHPIAVFYSVGVLCIGFGLMKTASGLWNRSEFVDSSVSRRLPSMVLTVFGVLSLLLAMVFDRREGPCPEDRSP